ncbi:VPEID-CTERM sorting domain-containing protein [Poseidonocella pacifica]|uniref:VPEID-CTERM sorting domain-containing protein n=1 Tax=Poseidonocella pacifica TaxID=871651 RepID=UPI001113C118|nr:VPEID-CTERM sorting domain-containing protein [Poseidonocella pacifica]
MKKFALGGFISSVGMFAASVASAASCGVGPTSPPCSVPEISAMEGTAALAAVAAVVLLTWERRRRAA